MNHSDSLLHQRIADAERLNSQQEKAENAAAKEALSGLIVKSQSSGGLTAADVTKIAPMFAHEPAALAEAYKLASGESTPTNPSVYGPLLKDAMDGAPDVYQRALHLVGNGINIGDFNRIMSVADRGMPNAVKGGTEFIDHALKPSPFDKYDPVAATRHASALMDYQDWVRNNPKATLEESNNQAKLITRTYAQQGVSQAMLAAQLPTYAVGARGAVDIGATQARILAAESKGVITHQEAVRQAELTANIAALQAQAAALAESKKAAK